MSTIKVIDVFAGPGGLNEGFSSSLDKNENPIFEIAGSFEMDVHAVRTLKLRAAAREAGGTRSGDYLSFLHGDLTLDQLVDRPDFNRAYEKASSHIHHVELGQATRGDTDRLIADAVKGEEAWVLVGGPPCQAYSLVGRARRGMTEEFLADNKHFLFMEYLHIIEEHRPTIFVMENVKGLLSATHRETRMFERILSDLSCAGEYEIRSLVVDEDDAQPRDFVIRSEQYGVPQRRHRVILLGVKRDLGDHEVLTRTPGLTSVKETIEGDLPQVRSLISPRRGDYTEEWCRLRAQGAFLAAKNGCATSEAGSAPGVAHSHMSYTSDALSSAMGKWLRPPGLERITLHEPRSHMPMDLVRYSYLAWMGQNGHRPTVHDLPIELVPNHKNVHAKTTPFVDRFRVQQQNAPSNTIVSHISKDGHYFIHPDPLQMRSLTVREAARLQTFPDDYFFVGPRTQQYHQVGNAVPPFLAHQIAKSVANLLGVT